MTSNRKRNLEVLIPFRNPLSVEPLVDQLALKKGYKNDSSVACHNTLIGIEVEVESVLRESHISKLEGAYLWRNTGDGSLRNNGREFVSTPIKGRGIPYAIDVLYRTLTHEKNCIGHEFTDRTSTHVHINYRDQTMESLANLILVYTAVEPFLYKFVGGDRVDNIYCVPITQSNLLPSLFRFFSRYEKDTTNCLSIAHEWMKYTGFNLLTLATYGTVEFRHLVGTDDVDKIKDWINLILCMKAYAERASYEDLKRVLLDLNTTSEYRGFIQSVFGSASTLLDLEDIQADMENTTIFIKDVFNYETVHVSALLSADSKDTSSKEFEDTLFYKSLDKYFIKVDPKKEGSGKKSVNTLSDDFNDSSRWSVELNRVINNAGLRGNQMPFVPPPTPQRPRSLDEVRAEMEARVSGGVTRAQIWNDVSPDEIPEDF